MGAHTLSLYLNRNKNKQDCQDWWRYILGSILDKVEDRNGSFKEWVRLHSVLLYSVILTKHAQNLHPPTLPVVRKRRMELPTTTLQLLQSSRMLAVCCHIVIPNVQTANIQVQCQSQLNSNWACVNKLGLLGVSVGGLENCPLLWYWLWRSASKEGISNPDWWTNLSLL